MFANIKLETQPGWCEKPYVWIWFAWMKWKNFFYSIYKMLSFAKAPVIVFLSNDATKKNWPTNEELLNQYDKYGLIKLLLEVLKCLTLTFIFTISLNHQKWIDLVERIASAVSFIKIKLPASIYVNSYFYWINSYVILKVITIFISELIEAHDSTNPIVEFKNICIDARSIPTFIAPANNTLHPAITYSRTTSITFAGILSTIEQSNTHHSAGN